MQKQNSTHLSLQVKSIRECKRSQVHKEYCMMCFSFALCATTAMNTMKSQEKNGKTVCIVEVKERMNIVNKRTREKSAKKSLKKRRREVLEDIKYCALAKTSSRPKQLESTSEQTLWKLIRFSVFFYQRNACKRTIRDVMAPKTKRKVFFFANA